MSCMSFQRQVAKKEAMIMMQTEVQAGFRNDGFWKSQRKHSMEDKQHSTQDTCVLTKAISRVKCSLLREENPPFH